ncbi:MAG: uroporphyrinogen decarboxylase family protein [Armatimonadota bacterium]
MLPKERVAAAYNHETPDKIPIYQASLSSAVASYVLGRESYVGGGIQQYREAVALWEGGEEAQQEFVDRSFEDACELCEVLDLDLVRTIHWRKPQMPAERIDENTFLYGDPGREEHWEIWRFDPPTETFGVVDKKPRPELTEVDLRRAAEESIQRAEEYDPHPDDFPDLQRSVERFGDTREIPGRAIGIAIPRDEEWLTATITHPDIVARYLQGRAMMSAKNAAVMVELGLPYCFGGGDFAGTKGPFYSPKVFHDLMLPALKTISDGCHEVGAYHSFASDGDLWPVAEDLFGRSGVDAFYEVDRNFMDMRDLRKAFAPLTLIGGIRSEVLHVGTVEEVEEETRSALQIAKEVGGCIIGCSNQVVKGTPEQNFWAMMEILHNERTV